MAAGKSLWVKLRYRIRPSSGSPATGQALDPTKTDAAIRSSLASPVFDSSLDFAFNPQHLLDMHTDSTVIATSIEHPHPISLPTPSMVPFTTADILSQRKRRKGTSSSKRSLSTGNISTHQTSDTAASMAEKRRNKLGYHRTSIACSHCRRRKIRCLAAPDDPHNRCANCIRLKKECNFFPVDQQPPIERRSRSGTQKSDKRPSHADTTRFGPNLLDTHHDHPNPFHGVAFTNQGFPAAAAWSSSGVVSPMTRGSVDHRASFDFNQPPQQHHQWPSPFHDPSPMSAGHSSPGDVSSTYWGGRHTDSPLTPVYSPHMSGPTTAVNGMDARSSVVSFAAAPRNDSTWSAPARSASIGMLEGSASPYPKHHSYPQASSLEFRRRTSEMHPPSLLTGSTHTSISESGLTPLSAPVSSPPDSWGIGPTWGTLPSSAVTKPTDFGAFYGEPLTRVQEVEEVPPPYGEQPAIVYADADHQ